MPERLSRPAPERRKAMDVITSLLPLEGAQIVDVGCGDGSLVRALTKRGARVTGIEILDDALRPPAPPPPPATNATSRAWARTCRCATTASTRWFS